jgi:hypothetical protein
VGVLDAISVGKLVTADDVGTSETSGLAEGPIDIVGTLEGVSEATSIGTVLSTRVGAVVVKGVGAEVTCSSARQLTWSAQTPHRVLHKAVMKQFASPVFSKTRRSPGV